VTASLVSSVLVGRDTNSENGQLGAYRNLLAAQTGKTITVEHAAVLGRLARAI
jgi:hypothetical protein